MDLITVVLLYVALLVVLLLHELGHLPREVRFRFFLGFLPMTYAYKGASRIGGLVVNVLLFTGVFLLQPEMVLLQLIGLVAVVHFVLYAVVGSILPEPDMDKVGSNYIFDDVPNKYWWIFIPLAYLIVVIMKDYYIGVVEALL